MRYTIALLLIASSLAFNVNAQALTVFTAKKIITMEPAMPEATAVAVEGDRIVAVGSLDSLQPLLTSRNGKVDRSLDGKVLMPGLISRNGNITSNT